MTGSSPTPLLMLGGTTNVLTVARSMGSAGIPVVYFGPVESELVASRFCSVIRAPESAGPAHEAWAEVLMSPAMRSLRGAVVLPGSDVGIETIAHHHAAFESDYHLDVMDTSAQLRLLDKLSTYEAGRAAGVPTPRFWRLESPEELESVREEVVYPLMVKPRLSHLFVRAFGRKHVVVDDEAALRRALEPVWESGVPVLLVERVPGGDDRLCSYYTHMDEAGEPAFHFTKRIIRRFPAGEGLGTYHATDWIPEVRDAALRLLRHSGLRGIANVEFMRDERDGQLKLIEVNARLTAANGLVIASGVDIARYVYWRSLGRPISAPRGFRTNLTLMNARADFHAYRQLRARGELTTLGWLRSIARPQRFMTLSITDPMPGLVSGREILARRLRRLSARATAWAGGMQR